MVVSPSPPRPLSETIGRTRRSSSGLAGIRRASGLAQGLGRNQKSLWTCTWTPSKDHQFSMKIPWIKSMDINHYSYLLKSMGISIIIHNYLFIHGSRLTEFLKSWVFHWACLRSWVWTWFQTDRGWIRKTSWATVVRARIFGFWATKLEDDGMPGMHMYNIRYSGQFWISN